MFADWKFILWSVLFVFGLCGTTIMWFTAIYHEVIFKVSTHPISVIKNDLIETILIIAFFAAAAEVIKV